MPATPFSGVQTPSGPVGIKEIHATKHNLERVLKQGGPLSVADLRTSLAAVDMLIYVNDRANTPSQAENDD